MKKNKTTVTAAYCESCKTWIYSRARHDFRRCFCDEIAIDGGRNYVKTSSKSGMPRTKQFTLDISEEELYDDWNSGTDKYGIIKNES